MRTNRSHGVQKFIGGDTRSPTGIGACDEIAERQDTYEPILPIDNRQTPHTPTLQHAQRIADIVILRAGLNIAGQHVTNANVSRCGWPRRKRNADIAVSDHPYHVTLAIDDRDDAAVSVPHDLRRLPQVSIGIAKPNVFRHDFLDCHRRPPCVELLTRFRSLRSGSDFVESLK
jgi:hypothetical protein